MKNKEELINQFKALPLSEQARIIKNTEKRWLSIKKKDNINNPIENYHYFTCPISNAKHCSYGKPYYDRFNTTEEEFKQAFPNIDTLYQTPYMKEQKPIKEIKTNNLTINGVTIYDIDTISAKARKSEYGSLKKLCETHNLNRNDLKEGLHYWICPITNTKVLRMNKHYFNRFDINKETFITMFPDIDVDTMQYNPYIDHYKINNTKTKPKPTPSNLKDEKWKARNSHLTRTEMINLKDSNDPDIMIYMEKVDKKSKDVIEQAMKESGLPVDRLNEWEHFLIHPITGGFTMKLNRMEVFGITQEAFLREFPEYKGRLSTRLSVNKSEDALNKVDEATGRTKRDMITEQRANKMKEINPETGKTYQEEAIEKTKNSHLTTIDEYGRNGYQRLADEHHGKRLQTLAKTRDYVIREDEYSRYERIVELMRHKMDAALKNAHPGNWAKHNQHKIDPTAIQADHEYSITQGFRDGLSPLSVGSINNIKVISAIDNASKGNSCSITQQELAWRCNTTIDEMKSEFNKIMEVIRYDIKNGIPHSTMQVLIRAGHDIALKMKPYYELERDYDPLYKQ